MAQALCSWIIVLIGIVFVIRFVSGIRQKAIVPPVTTWFIFLLGSGMSMATYVSFKQHDFQSGLLNMIDFTCIAIAFIAVCIWGDRSIPFTRLEKIALVFSVAIVVFWLTVGDARQANMLSQILITIGYIPTIHRLLTWKKNTESMFAWSTTLLAGMLGLVLALIANDPLAILYAVRGVVSVVIVLGLAAYYSKHSSSPAG